MLLKTKTYFNWSSGKDASMALYHLQEQGLKIEKLITTVNGHYHRVSMHGLRIELLEKQSQSVGIPLEMIRLPENPSMEEYNKIMIKVMKNLTNEGYNQCGFGDIFLEDLRKYREEQLKLLGIRASFPIWKRDTRDLIREFCDLGFKAKIICLDSSKLDESFLGREIDENFVDDLPSEVDPCGENGEFHTFCYDGPIFNHSVQFRVGERTFRQYEVASQKDETVTKKSAGFWFLDLVSTS